MALSPSPPSPPEPLARLRPYLLVDLAPFTVDGVRELLGPVATAALDREQTTAARRVLERNERDPRATFMRLFQFGETLPGARVAAAFPNVGVAGLVELGLVRRVSSSSSSSSSRTDDDVAAAVELSPYGGEDERGALEWWIASDLSEMARGDVLAAGHVLGVGGASRTLAQLTIRRPVGRVLDLGTGCGIQALHAARHARVVVATDVDERALAFTRFNAALNLGAGDGVVQTRRGSLLEPVAGERFDLVVSNPPFVITPRGAAVTEFTYRDGGAAGDDLVRDLLRSIGDALEPGGVAQLLANWEHRAGRAWQERIAGWFAPGCDAWVVEREVQDPAEYAELWLRDGGQTPERDAGYEVAYRAWLADLESRDVEGIGFGFVTVRRRRDSRDRLRHRRDRLGEGLREGLREGADWRGGGADGADWTRLEAVTGTVAQPLGATIADVLDAVDRWADASAAELLEERWVVADDVTEERFHAPGEPSASVILLRAGGGFGRTVRCDTALAAFVGACDGELTGGQIVAALAVLLEVDAATLGAELLPHLRGLVIDGVLAAASSSS